MGKRRQRPEQIISKLREAEVELARGMKVPEVCKKLGIAEYTHYRWSAPVATRSLSWPRDSIPQLV